MDLSNIELLVPNYSEQWRFLISGIANAVINKYKQILITYLFSNQMAELCSIVRLSIYSDHQSSYRIKSVKLTLFITILFAVIKVRD